jgi:carbon storage regulator CsrA
MGSKRMLVLTRKVGEKIEIGLQRKILITIVGIRGGRIQLGIDADPSIPVQRVISESAAVFQQIRSPKE